MSYLSCYHWCDDSEPVSQKHTRITKNELAAMDVDYDTAFKQCVERTKNKSQAEPALPIENQAELDGFYHACGMEPPVWEAEQPSSAADSTEHGYEPQFNFSVPSSKPTYTYTSLLINESGHFCPNVLGKIDQAFSAQLIEVHMDKLTQDSIMAMVEFGEVIQYLDTDKTRRMYFYQCQLKGWKADLETLRSIHNQQKPPSMAGSLWETEELLRNIEDELKWVNFP